MNGHVFNGPIYNGPIYMYLGLHRVRVRDGRHLVPWRRLHDHLQRGLRDHLRALQRVSERFRR